MGTRRKICTIAAPTPIIGLKIRLIRDAIIVAEKAVINIFKIRADSID